MRILHVKYQDGTAEDFEVTDEEYENRDREFWVGQRLWTLTDRLSIYIDCIKSISVEQKETDDD